MEYLRRRVEQPQPFLETGKDSSVRMMYDIFFEILIQR